MGALAHGWREGTCHRLNTEVQRATYRQVSESLPKITVKSNVE